jgi:hypothetical protein
MASACGGGAVLVRASIAMLYARACPTLVSPAMVSAMTRRRAGDERSNKA